MREGDAFFATERVERAFCLVPLGQRLLVDDGALGELSGYCLLFRAPFLFPLVADYRLEAFKLEGRQQVVKDFCCRLVVDDRFAGKFPDEKRGDL